MNIDINGVKITLTKEQLKQIREQTSNQITIENIDYRKAIKLLSDNNIKIDPKCICRGDLLKLVTIVKACNYIDNGNKEWKPDYNENSNTYKYYPYFEFKNEKWAFGGSYCHCFFSSAEVAVFKSKDTCDYISTKYIDLFNSVL